MVVAVKDARSKEAVAMPRRHFTNCAALYDVAGNLTSIEDPLGNVTEFDYDGNGNLIEIKQPKPNVSDFESARPIWTFEYDALNLLVREIDPRDYNTLYDYDERLNLALVSLPAPDGSYENRSNWRYYYNLADELTGEIDPMDRLTQYGYDAAGRLETVTLPDPDGAWGPESASTWTYGYDKNGNLTSITQPLGQETTRVFDPLNRLKQIIEEIPVSGASHPTTTFTYDAADNNRSVPAAGCPA